MENIVLLTVLLLLSCQTQGSRDVTRVFVKKGGDVRLDVAKADVPEKFFVFVWNFNTSERVVTFSPDNKSTISHDYRGRVDVYAQNYSVTLKNLQEKDSGVYTARVTVVEGDRTPAEYSVTVQAPVSLVNLTVDSVSNSSDSCNLTVTCRTQDSDISSTFTCVNQNCSQDRARSKITTSGAVLLVYVENGWIKCNHSNKVSWTTNQGQMKIQDFCPHQPDGPTNGAVSMIVVGSVLTCVILSVTIVVLILCIRKKNKENIQPNENREYDVPQNPDQTENPVMSTYALVQFPKEREPSTHTRNIPLPETIYAQVKKPATSNISSS